MFSLENSERRKALIGWARHVAARANYPRIDKDHPMYALTQCTLFWTCDSLDHNDHLGCSNPACFKHDSATDYYRYFIRTINDWKKGIFKVWITSDFRMMPVEDISDEHLSNILCKMSRKPDWRPEWKPTLLKEHARRHEN